MTMNPKLLRPRQTTDANAAAYIAAVESADGQSLEGGVKKAIDTFVKGCKADGTWSLMRSACILSGARTLSGAIVPLRGGTITSSNFVSGDYARKTGLKGGSAAQNKTLLTSLLANSLPQLSHHFFVAGSSFESLGSATNAGGVFVSAASSLFDMLIGGSPRRARSGTFDGAGNSANAPAGGATSGSLGCSRTSATEFRYFENGVSGTAATNSNTPALPALALSVFARNDNGGRSEHTASRLHFFCFGEGLTQSQMSALHTRVSSLNTAIQAAIP